MLFRSKQSTKPNSSLTHLSMVKFLPPFQVKRLELSSLQLNKAHRQALRSLQSDQLEALAMTARLLATTLRDETEAKGVLKFWDYVVSVHDKETLEKKREQEKVERENKPQSMTWDSLLKNLSGF